MRKTAAQTMRYRWQLSDPGHPARNANSFLRFARLLLITLITANSALHSPAQPSASTPQATKNAQAQAWLAPAALASSADAKRLFIASAKGRRVDVFDVSEGKVTRSFPVPGEPSGLVVGPDERLYVTCAGPESRVCEINLTTGNVSGGWLTGHTALSPTLSADAKTLYVCLRFNNQIALLDRATGREVGRIAVGREPVSVAPTPDGKFLWVAHHLPSGRADLPGVTATVGLIDLQTKAMAKELPLPSGSSLLRQIQLSPDGRYAVLTHNLARYQVPTTQLERGWMNTSALTIIDVSAKEIFDTVLLDELDRGAANPWATAWSNHGQQLLVTHAGTHEVSVIDFAGLMKKLSELHANPKRSELAAPADDLSFLIGLRQRVQLAGNGPRSITMAGQRAYVASYFSDTLEILDTGKSPFAAHSICLQESEKSTATTAAPRTPSTASVLRDGERLFNDATICFQGWQSCTSCHSDDARVDGLNWDLLNDGIGNPKNSKSLLLSHVTPPSMSMGVRYTAEAAVKAGIEHILFTVPSAELTVPLNQWLKSLKPIPSPYLQNGRLSPAAKRGEKLFRSAKTGCASCHTSATFTNLRSYDVGTSSPSDRGLELFDTPTLVELWRTGPYLHDGSAATLLEVFTARNVGDRHGHTSHLSKEELDCLVEYLLSL